jgi:hypothetical protein
MKELVVASILGLGALLVSGQMTEKKEVDNTVESVEFETCLCMIGGECDCDPCMCVNCECKKDEVVETPVFVENKFNSVPMEMDIADLKSKVFMIESDVNKVVKDIEVLKAKPHLTEDMVKDIVKKEFKVQIELMNTKTNEKVVKNVSVQHTGTEIVLNPGEILTHIDGVPVNGNPYSQFVNGKRVMMFRTPSFQANV